MVSYRPGKNFTFKNWKHRVIWLSTMKKKQLSGIINSYANYAMIFLFSMKKRTGIATVTLKDEIKFMVLDLPKHFFYLDISVVSVFHFFFISDKRFWLWIVLQTNKFLKISCIIQLHLLCLQQILVYCWKVCLLSDRSESLFDNRSQIFL